MNITKKMVCAPIATLTLIGSLIGEANAAVLISFEQVNNDVLVTMSGSLDLQNLTFDQIVNRSSGVPARLTNTQLLSNLGGSESRWTGGVSPSVFFPDWQNLTGSGVANSSTYLGDLFFINTSNELFLPGSLTSSSTSVNLSGTWTYTNETISNIWGDVSTTPYTVYTAGSSGSDVIQIVQVPEPSSSLLFSIASLSLAFRRSRY